MIPRAGRTGAYSAVGFAHEVVFSALHDRLRGREVRLRTSPWSLHPRPCPRVDGSVVTNAEKSWTWPLLLA